MHLIRVSLDSLGVKGHTHRKPLKPNLSRNAWLPNASLQRETDSEDNTAPNSDASMGVFMTNCESKMYSFYE